VPIFAVTMASDRSRVPALPSPYPPPRRPPAVVLLRPVDLGSTGAAGDEGWPREEKSSEEGVDPDRTRADCCSLA
jgi:hypothetical protein